MGERRGGEGAKGAIEERDGTAEEFGKTRGKESGREEDEPLSASPKTNQTGARLTNQRHP